MPEISTLSNLITSKELNSLSLLNDANLRGYWRLESNFTDSGPSGYNLTGVNTPTDVAGKFGNGKDFEASSSQRAGIADASCPNLEISGSQTWMCWVKPEALTSYQSPMSKNDSGNTNPHRFLVSDDAGGVVYFDMSGLTTNTQVNSGALTIKNGVWSHLVGVYDSAASKLRIYVNGALGGELTASGSAADSNGDFVIGGDGATGIRYFDGIVDDAAIFNRALTHAEILSIYREPVGYFKLEDVNDSSAYGRNLTNNNTVTFPAGKFNNGASGGTVDANKTLTNTANFEYRGGVYSISLWFKINTELSGGDITHTFFYLTEGTVSKTGLGMHYERASGVNKVAWGRVRWNVTGESGTYNVDLGTDFHHFVFTYDGTTAKGYLDSVERASFAASGDGSGVVPQMLILLGQSNDVNANNALGMIDDVALFTRALTAAEVRSIYLSGTAGAFLAYL